MGKKKPIVAKKIGSGNAPGTQENLARHQWKPGQSGNPLGKPKGARNFRTTVKNILDNLVTQHEAAQPEDKRIIQFLEEELGHRITRRDLMVYRQVALAFLGDTRAFSALADREEGKPTQKVATDQKTYEQFLEGVPDEVDG